MNNHINNNPQPLHRLSLPYGACLKLDLSWIQVKALQHLPSLNPPCLNPPCTPHSLAAPVTYVLLRLHSVCPTPAACTYVGCLTSAPAAAHIAGCCAAAASNTGCVGRRGCRHAGKGTEPGGVATEIPPAQESTTRCWQRCRGRESRAASNRRGQQAWGHSWPTHRHPDSTNASHSCIMMPVLTDL